MELGFNSDDVALVTGGSRGIGAAIVRVLAAEGVTRIKVVGRGGADLDALAAVVHEQHGTTVERFPLDLSDPVSRASLAPDLADVTLLVNNAGAIPQGRLPGADLGAWRTAWDLKVWGYLHLTSMALEIMSSRGSGVVLNVIGVSGERHDASYVAGSAANAALMAMTRAVGASSLDSGVRVVALNPGPVETERLLGALRRRAEDEFGDAEAWPRYVQTYPAGRIATADEVADTAVFLLSPRSAYTSGCVVTLDGGMAWQGRAL